MRSTSLSWLVARPIAHRGLHGGEVGPVENTLAAAAAAAAAGFAIECDVRLARDGTVVVFHDDRLERLTDATGALGERTAAELATVAFRRGTPGVPSLAALLDTVAGRVPLVVEIKSAFDGDGHLAIRTAAAVAGYGGPLALKSFDVEILARLRAEGCPRPLGLVAEARYHPDHWRGIPPRRLSALRRHDGLDGVGPDFVSWAAADLPHPGVTRLRAAGRPVITWTVRRPEERRRVGPYADQIVFEAEALAR